MCIALRKMCIRDRDHSEECMEMIANAGEATTLALNALSLAGQGAFEEAEKVLQDSQDALNKAHAAHTTLLFCEAEDEDLKVTLLKMHAGDHLNLSLIHIFSKAWIYRKRTVTKSKA